MASKLYCKENMFDKFNEATQLKTSLVKYSLEFNDIAVQMRPHRIAYLRLLGRPYTLLYVRRSLGRLVIYASFFDITSHLKLLFYEILNYAMIVCFVLSSVVFILRKSLRFWNSAFLVAIHADRTKRVGVLS